MLTRDKNRNDRSEMLPEDYHIVSFPTDQIGEYIRIDWFAIDPDPESPTYYCACLGYVPKSVGLLDGDIRCVMTGYSLISLS